VGREVTVTHSRNRGAARAPADAPLRTSASVDGHQTMCEGRRILVCDSESQSLHALRVVLRGVGFEVVATRTASDALNRGALYRPTAAIVELVLSDGDGVEVCRRLREWSAMPVILLSAVRDEEEQVRAFEAGADDYVTKPFRPRELVARLVANLRRTEPGGQEPCVELGGLVIDLAARTVRRDGEEIHLTRIEFELLGVLVQNRGRLLTHNELLQQVWGVVYSDARQTLRAHIANLRRKIEPADGGRLIHTDHGVGYRLSDGHPGGARRRRPTEEATDREVVSSGALDSGAGLGCALKYACASGTHAPRARCSACDYEVSRMPTTRYVTRQPPIAANVGVLQINERDGL
jgi:two-component system, OmpR family, KDP operon response regulator KdpE